LWLVFGGRKYLRAPVEYWHHAGIQNKQSGWPTAPFR
jgi:hypothetical protein